jgi:hypothetical protein
MIGRQAGVNSTNIYSIMLGTFAGTKASGSYNTLIGYSAGSVADPYSSGIGGNNLEISSSGSNFLASILTGKSNKINIQETIVGDNTTKKLAIGKVGASNLNPNATLEVIANISTDKVLISKGAISQTANLIEAQSSSGTTLFSVDSGGYISTPSSGLATWNASLLNGYSVSNASPSSGQVLTWNGTSWTPVSTALNGNNIFTGNVVLNGAVSGVLSNTNINTIDSTPYSSGDCIKYIIRTKYGNTTQGSEILLVSDGTDTYMTEYAQVYTSGQLITFSADYNSSNIRLLGQAKYSNTSVHMMKVLIS